MMDAFYMLIQEFVTGRITADEFESRYIVLWRETWDDSDMPAAMKTQRAELMKAHLSKAISEEHFTKKYRALQEPYWAKRSIQPFSEESRVLSDLFLEVDAYSNDPDTSYSITADELREAAQTALNQLLALEKRA